MNQPASDIGFMAVVNPHRERVPLLAVKRGALVYREDRVTVARALRDDPLARLHHHHQVTEAQYHAGRRWQALYEDSQVGRMGSSGDLKEPVDGSRRIAEPLSDKQRKAARQILEIDAILGRVGASLTRDILGEGLSFDLAAVKHGRSDRMMREWIGKRFRECLTTLAKELGYG